MPKKFVLDTNVLLHDPRAMFHFEENEVIIPIFVLEEVDQFKKELSERGRNARTVSRYLDELRAAHGKLSEGVPLDNGGRLRVALASRPIPQVLQDRHKMDNYILAVALEVAEQNPEVPTIFVTKDVNLRVRADALGLKAEDYQADKIDIDELYSGVTSIEVSTQALELFRSEHFLTAQDDWAKDLMPNQFVILTDASNDKNSALARYDAWQHRLVQLQVPKEGIWDIRPRNKEQRFAFDLLLNDDIKLVTLVGKAGTGKTLLAIAAGLYKVVDAKAFVRLLVSRPIFPLGRDIGYLPGDVEEKLTPWMQPIYDNVELLMRSGPQPGQAQQGKRQRTGGDGYKTLMEMGYMQIEPLTYIRGRSIPNQFMIVDEAQNLTPHEVKTIITRVGDNTKIVLTGDPYQIDNPYVDSSNNGLTYVVERFKQEKMSGHITMVKGERSPLAELAANLL